MSKLNKKLKGVKVLKALGEKNPEVLLIPDILEELRNTKASIPSPFDDRPLVQELSDLKDSLAMIGDQIRDSIREIAKNVTLTIAEKDAKTEETIKKLNEELKKLEKDFIFRLSQVGGGAMNRQIRVNGTNYLTRYTDINLIGSITAADDNTNKRVNITFASGGVGAWSTPPEAVQPDGSVTVFTVGGSAPTDVVSDGINLYNGFGYTYSAGQITLVNGPTQFIRYR